MAESRQVEERSAARQRADAVYETIRDRIRTNRYPPGLVLREEDLARDFSVSRTPIRRVLSMLEHDGLVTPGTASARLSRRSSRSSRSRSTPCA